MGDVFYSEYTQLFQPSNTTAWSESSRAFNHKDQADNYFEKMILLHSSSFSTTTQSKMWDLPIILGYSTMAMTTLRLNRGLRPTVVTRLRSGIVQWAGT